MTFFYLIYAASRAARCATTSFRVASFEGDLHAEEARRHNVPLWLAADRVVQLTDVNGG